MILKPKRRLWGQGQGHRGKKFGKHGKVLSQGMCSKYKRCTSIGIGVMMNLHVEPNAEADADANADATTGWQHKLFWTLSIAIFTCSIVNTRTLRYYQVNIYQYFNFVWRPTDDSKLTTDTGSYQILILAQLMDINSIFEWFLLIGFITKLAGWKRLRSWSQG